MKIASLGLLEVMWYVRMPGEVARDLGFCFMSEEVDKKVLQQTFRQKRLM
jgi:hypothetical protein